MVFAQGAKANSVFYLQDGAVKLSVLSSEGKEAVVGMLGPGDFFGEGSLAGQPFRMGKLGFIEYNGGLSITINNSLLSVVLHD